MKNSYNNSNHGSNHQHVNDTGNGYRMCCRNWTNTNSSLVEGKALLMKLKTLLIS